MIPDAWRRCSSCKKPIPYGSAYWVCSVSTCNRRATSYVFCTDTCWDQHVPLMNHRDAWAEERRAPSREQAAQELAESDDRAARAAAKEWKEPPMTPPNGTAETPHEVLVVASKLKAYIRARSGMNTSGNVMEALSDKIRALCDQAIENARSDGRKTVMDRDFG